MNPISQSAHGLVIALTQLSHWLITAVNFAEDGLRLGMQQIGVNRDFQTLLLLFVLSLSLFGVLRMTRGLVRSIGAVLLILILMQTLEQLSQAVPQ